MAQPQRQSQLTRSARASSCPALLSNVSKDAERQAQNPHGTAQNGSVSRAPLRATQAHASSWDVPSLQRASSDLVYVPYVPPAMRAAMHWSRARPKWSKHAPVTGLPCRAPSLAWLSVDGASSQQDRGIIWRGGSSSQPILPDMMPSTPPGWKKRPVPAMSSSPSLLWQCADEPSSPSQPVSHRFSRRPSKTSLLSPLADAPLHPGEQSLDAASVLNALSAALPQQPVHADEVAAATSEQSRADADCQELLEESCSISASPQTETQRSRESRAFIQRKRADADKALNIEKPARIAVVGAGPVGLWVAVLLAREHAKMFATTAGFRITRPPSAPIIDVFERRTDNNGYGTRRIILAMSDASQTLLNQHMTSGRELCANHNFAPACSINLVESSLREEFEKFAANGFGSLQLGDAVPAPEELLKDHDVVFVATGRGFPSEEWRQERGMQVRVGRTETALILKFALETTPDLSRTLAELADSLARLEVKGQPHVFLRPGPTDEEGYVWLLGLSADALARIGTTLEDKRGIVFTSFRQMWSELTTTSTSSSLRKKDKAPKAAFALMDKQLKAINVSARVSEASFWHSDEIVQRVERPDASIGWIVLVGDAACGKPFYLGSTLNGHFNDLTSLISGPWLRWKSAMKEAAEQQGTSKRHGQVPEGAVPFKRYVEQYRKRVDNAGFRGG